MHTKTLNEIESVKLIQIDILCIICDKFIEKKMIVTNKNNYKMCPDCENNLHLWKSI